MENFKLPKLHLIKLLFVFFLVLFFSTYTNVFAVSNTIETSKSYSSKELISSTLNFFHKVQITSINTLSSLSNDSLGAQVNKAEASLSSIGDNISTGFSSLKEVLRNKIKKFLGLLESKLKYPTLVVTSTKKQIVNKTEETKTRDLQYPKVSPINLDIINDHSSTTLQPSNSASTTSKSSASKIIERIIEKPTTTIINQADPTFLSRLQNLEQFFNKNISFNSLQVDRIYDSVNRNISSNSNDIKESGTLNNPTFTGTTILHGVTTLDSSFSQTGANTFSTGTGAISLNGTTTTTGQSIFTFIPTLAHSFSPAWPLGTSNVANSTLYINPASAVADSNLLGLAVNGAAKFIVDAEGDIYAKNLILEGSTTSASNTIGTLNVTDNTTLGDAITDTITINGVMSGFTMTGNLALGSNTFTTSNTGLVTNLNADLLDGQHGSYYATASSLGSYVPYTGATGNVTLGTYSLTTPNILGGTSTTQDLTLQTTSGVGATGADMHFLVGNNGATEAMTILNDGKVGINTIAPNDTLQVKTTGQGSISFGGSNGREIHAYDAAGAAANFDMVAASTYFSGDLVVGGQIKSTSSGNLILATQTAGKGVAIGNITPTANLHIKAGTATANTAPLKFTSGTLLTTPEAGAIEFLTDAYYGTITTGGARKQFAFTSDLTSGYVPYTGATGNVTLGTYSLTTPNILGGTSTTQDLTLQTTSGVGATGADMHFLVGNNGATEAMTILNSGSVGIGTTSPTYKLDVKGTAVADGIRSDMGFDIYQVPNPTVAPTGVVSAGGLVDTGTHYYYVSYITATGETQTKLSGVITTTAGNNTVTLTIPTSTDPRVTGRKLYRSKAGRPSSEGLNLATVADNTSTEYIDIIADASLTGTITNGDGPAVYRANTTTQYLTVNGTKSLTVDSNATYFGLNAGASINGGGKNTFIGLDAGRYATTATSNVFIGDTAGGQGTVTGYDNILIGTGAGRATTSGYDSVGIGFQSLLTNTTGYQNTTMGSYSMYSNTTGYANTAIGMNSLRSNTTGYQNIALGFNAGRYITDGATANATSNNSVYLGYATRASADANTNEIVVGYTAIGNGSNTATWGNTSILNHFFSGNINASKMIGGSSTTADLTLQTTSGVGATGADMHFLVGNAGATEAMTILNDGSVGIGTPSPNNLLQVNDLITFTNADWKTQIGYQAGKYDLGQYNTWIGYQSGSADNATGKTNVADNNTAIGYRSLYSNTTGLSNTAIGYVALGVNLTGTYNTATGYNSMMTNDSGSLNAAYGGASLRYNTSGGDNVAIGADSLQGNTTGSRNSALGRHSGRYIADGATANQTSTDSVYLGYNTKALASGDTNEIVVGSGTIGNGSNTATWGNTSVTDHFFSGDVNIGRTTSGAYRVDVDGTTAAHGIRSSMGFDIYPVPNPTTISGVVSAGGSVDTGTHYYWVSYTTATGETYAALSSVITTTAGNNTVTLTIPTSTDPRVTGRKLYRTKAGASSVAEYFLATIANNTDVSYVDTVADSTLTGSTGVVNTRANTTSRYISVGGIRAAIIDGNITSLGVNAALNLTTAPQVTLFGSSAGTAITSGGYNSAFGYRALVANQTGTGNAAFGTSTLAGSTGSYNASFGSNSFQSTTTGTGNVGLGYFAMFGNTTGSYNTALGYFAGRFHADGTTALTDAENSIYIGAGTRGLDNSDSNSIVVGYNAIGMGANTAVWGNTSVLNHYFSGNINATNILGGSSTTQDLTLQTTSGVGATGADMHFLVGNNGATEAMTILNSGNVGINNISPANKLSIHNNLGNPDAILISRAASTDSMSIKFLPNGALSPSNTAFYQGVQASSNNYSINTWDGTTWYEPLTVTPTNRVGVGVTGPTAGLHLKAGTATANTAPLKFTSGTLLTTPEAGAIEFLTDAYYGTITTGGARKTFAFLESPVFTTNITTPIILGGTSTTQDLTLQTTSGVGATGADMHFLVGNNGATEAMTILNEGNVGIGATAFTGGALPSVGTNKFIVGGNSGTNLIVTDYSAYSIIASIGASEGNVTLGDSGTTSGNRMWNFNSNDGTLSIRRLTDSQNGIFSTPLVINSTNNVGIGTTSPTYKLDVKGTAVADGIRSDMGFDIYSVPSPTTLSGVVSAGGSVDTGTHYYYVTFTTAVGETNSKVSSVITTTAGNNTVTLTIPVSTDPRVTGRKLYRTRAGDSSFNDSLLATIANNTDVSYVDTAADSTLPAAAQVSFGRINSTSNFITVQGTKAMVLDTNLTTFGVSAGAAITTGSNNAFFGYRAGYSLTTSGGNIAIGGNALEFATTTTGNTAVGYLALRNASTGGYNTGLGYLSLYGNTTGTYNVGLGREALYGNTTGTYNVGIGYIAGRYIADGATANTTSDYSLYLGYNSKAGADGNQNEIVIGYNAVGNGSNTTTIGTGNVLYVGGSSISGIAARFTNSAGYCDINPLTTSLACTSDISLKKNIVTLDDVEFALQTVPDILNKSVLERINSLTPVNYNWKSEIDGDSKHVGFIAQEMEQLFPDLVSTDEKTGLKSISYSSLTPYLVKAVQEMNLMMIDINSFKPEDIENDTNPWRVAITSWLGNATNKITRIFTGEVCLTDETGDTECINKDELRSLKTLINTSGTASVVTPTDTNTPTSPTGSAPTTSPSSAEETITPPNDTTPTSDSSSTHLDSTESSISPTDGTPTASPADGTSTTTSDSVVDTSTTSGEPTSASPTLSTDEASNNL